MPRFQILLFQGLLWLGILLTQTFLIGGGENILETIPKSGIIVLGQMTLVYFNTLFLFPKLYLKKKHFLLAFTYNVLTGTVLNCMSSSFCSLYLQYSKRAIFGQPN